MSKLQNKTVLITGSSRGIGNAIAKLFHSQGASVIITDINDKQGEELSNLLGERSEYLHLNVKHQTEWQKVADHISSIYGALDVLVNNAGITGFLESKGPYDAENVDLESWNEVHNVNSFGVMLGCKYGIKLMKEKGGSIINISSRSGIVGIPEAVAYASSKASVRNHTKSVALYCADKNYNIRCNSIHPAAIMTPMWEEVLGEGEKRKNTIKSIERGIPLGHFGEAIDVAYGALYLACEESKYVTGIELNIDGGILAGSNAKPNK